GGVGDQQLDAPGGDLRRGHIPPLRQRHPGGQPRPDGVPAQLHQPLADRRRQPLGAILPRAHRRGPPLQRGPDTLPDPHPAPPSPPPAPGPEAPTPPSTPAPPPRSPSQTHLSWTASTDNVGVTGSLVERQDPGSVGFVQIGTTTATTFTDTGLTPATSYSYR